MDQGLIWKNILRTAYLQFLLFIYLFFLLMLILKLNNLICCSSQIQSNRCSFLWMCLCFPWGFTLQEKFCSCLFFSYRFIHCELHTGHTLCCMVQCCVLVGIKFIPHPVCSYFTGSCLQGPSAAHYRGTLFILALPHLVKAIQKSSPNSVLQLTSASLGCSELTAHYYLMISLPTEWTQDTTKQILSYVSHYIRVKVIGLNSQRYW